MDSIFDKLTNFFIVGHQLTEQTPYELKTYVAKELLVPERLDLVAKIRFLDWLTHKKDCKFLYELYKQHLVAFSGGVGCSEPGDDTKNNINDYVNAFERIAADICKRGFVSDVSLVPVGKNGVILDGAHRVSSAIYYQKTVETVVFDNIEVNYGSDYFAKRWLEEKYLDYLTLEYCKLKENTFVFCIWPRADVEKREDIFSIIRQKTRVIYEKEIDLTYTGYRNFMIQIYRNDGRAWIGDAKNHYKGVYNKLDACYCPGIPLKIFVVEATGQPVIQAIKEELRQLWGIGNHSIHSTSNQQETIYMLNLLLNRNSVDLLNYGNPDYYATLETRIERIRQAAVAEGINCDDFIIDSSSVLGLYGLREPGDTDYIFHDGSDLNILGQELCDNNHHHHHHLYGVSVDDLLYDPDKYLFYNGIKFVTLEMLYQFKKNRGEKKDLVDMELIRQFRKNNCNTIKNRINRARISTVRVIRKWRPLTIYVLKKSHLYNPIRKIIKGR